MRLSMRYRIYSGRFDVTEYEYHEFDAPTDEKAKEIFEKESDSPACAWNHMRLVCIEQVERRRPVATNKNYEKFLNQE
jgi:hypothetical protein